MRDLSNLVNKFKFKVSHTDYQHLEMEGPTEIGLDYFDKGTDAKFEIVHSLLSCLLYTSPSPRDRQKSRMPVMNRNTVIF